MPSFLARLPFAALLAGAFPAMAGDAKPLPELKLPADAAWSVTVQRDGIDDLGDGQKKSWSVRRTYAATISAPDGASERNIVWTPKDSSLTGAPPVDALALLHGAPLAYWASPALKPRELADWPAVRTAIQSLSLKGTSAEASQPLLAKLAQGLDEKSAAMVLLKPARMLAMPLDIPLPFQTQDQVASPLGGPPVLTTYRMSLEPGTVNGERVVLYQSTLDPASAAASTNAVMAKLGKQASAAMAMTRQEDCRFTVDAATAMPKAAHCTLRTTIQADGKTAERIDNLHVIIERQTP